ALAAFGIFIPGGDVAGKSDDQNVVPTVLVEIVGEGEKVVRVSVVRAQRAFEALNGLLAAVGLLLFKSLCCRVIFVAVLEVRPFVPIGTRNDVHPAVVIEIAEVGALAPELVAALG